MKIKEKIIDVKKSVDDFGKEHSGGIITTVLAVANVAVIGCIGYVIISSKREVAIDIENGLMVKITNFQKMEILSLSINGMNTQSSSIDR